MNIREVKEDGYYTIVVEGRVDTANAGTLQQQILTTFQKTKNVVLDFSEVEYICSWGLRAVLLGQKTATAKQGSLVLKNTGDDVMKILKTVGFDKILTFE